jgi:hypothetical protein
LLNDRDVYALSAVKIPIKKNSILAHQYESQLKYGDLNLNRLNTNIRLDSSLERELADKKLLEEFGDEEDNMAPINGSNNNTDFTMESQFSNRIEMSDNGATFDDYDDRAALILNTETTFNRTNELQNSNNQTKGAKLFFKKIDNEFESLKNQNQDIINNVNNQTNIEQLIPISSYSIETNKKESSYFMNNFFSTRDVLIIACFVIVLVPLALFIYSFYYNEEHHHHHPN